MPISMNTAATQGVSHTQTGKRPIAWTKRVNMEQEPLSWTQFGEAEPSGINFEHDFLEAIGHSEQMLNTPPMEQEDVNNQEFESPEMDAEWDMHAELEGLQPSQPTEQDLFSSLAPAEAEHDLFACVAPTEAEGRVPFVASEVTITNNNPMLNQLNNNENNNCELMSELNRVSTIIPEPMAPDNLENEIVADQENNPMLANLTDTWLQEYFGNTFIGEENFLDSVDAVINSDITAFPAMVEVDPEPLIPEPKEEKPSQLNILEQAIGETLYPVDNVSIEVIDNNTFDDDDEEWEEKPKVRKVRKARGSRIVKKEHMLRKKTVGRPARQGPIAITEIPEAGLTKEQREALKYRRMRDLNNEASRKCRKVRKAKANKAETLLEEERSKNEELLARLQKIEAERDKMKDTLARKGLLPPASV